MVIDCHYHLETRLQSIDNLLEKMDAARIDKVALMATMWDVPPHIPAFLTALLRFLLYHRLLRPIGRIFATRFSARGDIVVLNQTVKLYPDPDNAPVAEAVKQYPDKFTGWIFINPKGKNAPLEQFEQWKDVAGFIGVKAHSYWHSYEPRTLTAVAEKAAEAHMPLLLHTGFGAQGDFLALADAVPELKLILAHAAFPGFSDTWKEIRTRPNIFVDLSADTYVDAKLTFRAVEYLGEDRCLFGTDGPYGAVAEDGLFDNGYLKRRIESLFTNDRIRAKLMGENFSKLIEHRL